MCLLFVDSERDVSEVAHGALLGTVITISLISCVVLIIALIRKLQFTCRSRNKKGRCKDDSFKDDISIYQDQEKSPDIIPSVNKGQYS